MALDTGANTSQIQFHLETGKNAAGTTVKNLNFQWGIYSGYLSWDLQKREWYINGTSGPVPPNIDKHHILVAAKAEYPNGPN